MRNVVIQYIGCGKCVCKFGESVCTVEMWMDGVSAV